MKPVVEQIFGSKLAERGIYNKRKRDSSIKKVKGGPDNRFHFYENIMLKHVIHATENTSLEQAENNLATLHNEMEKQQNENNAKVKTVHECIYCALDNAGGNMPLFESVDPLKVQQHIIFKHPGLDFEYVTVAGAP